VTRRLILLRHGQTHYNATMRMQGQLDTELSERGRAQAAAAAKAIAPRGPRAIYSSDLARAMVTAEELAAVAGLPVHPDRRLRETDLGTWQGMSHLEVDEQWPGARGVWRSTPTWRPSGGETRLEVARRARSLVDELVAEIDHWGKHPVVLVAHGGAIAALTAALLELPVSHFALFNGLGNTAWAQLSSHPRADDNPPADDAAVPPEGDAARAVLWRLDAWNVAPHLETR